MNKRFLLPLLLYMFSSFAQANEVALDQDKIPTDRAAVLRGAEQVATVCASCHGLKYVQYRNLLELGIAQETVDTWRSDNPLNSAMQPQMDPAVAQTMFGLVPPDLSLIAVARKGGVHYVYSYLMGYAVNENGVAINRIDNVSKMPDILGIASATDAKQREKISANAKDITAFLSWAADPHAEDRKNLGIYVMIYLFIMIILLLLWKKQIWRKVDAMGKVK